MKRVYASLLFIILLSAPVFSQTSLISDTFRIFAANLSTSPASVRLGNATKVIFSAQKLAPADVSRMTVAKAAGEYQLYFKTGNANLESSPGNSIGRPYLYILSPGKTYLIKILSETEVDLIELTAPVPKNTSIQSSQHAEICFMNASSRTIPVVQVAKAWNQMVAVSMKNLSPHDISNFGSINVPSEYGCFWTSDGGATNAQVSTLSDAKSIPLVNSFADLSWWALLIYDDTKAGKINARLISIDTGR